MPNRLAGETSPYLLQHAENPVDWYPWGDEAFAEARRRDVPVFLSVGYSSCHWCHVMAHESFEDEAIGAYLNEHFVSIKVDREERPDVDAVYMTATQALTGHGGWPMSVFLDHLRRPFYAGTYWPRQQRQGMPAFPQVLQALVDAWRNRRDEIDESSASIAEALAATTRVTLADAVDPGVADEAAKAIVERAWDRALGGFGRAPKFPQAMTIGFLLDHHARTGDVGARDAAVQALDAMARGGIYDHVGGGFARYSTDARWLVPHFEKMLYDNALLVDVYARAAALTGRGDLARVARETADYLLREMQAPDGGFYSATDADSEGVEGKFFVWPYDELVEVVAAVDADPELFAEYFGASPEGNFAPEHPGEDAPAGTNILHEPVRRDEFARAHDRDPEVFAAELARVRLALYERRQGRVPPGLDDKILTSWNALAIRGLARAGAYLDEPRYVEAAVRAASFLRDRLVVGGALHHTYKDGRAAVPGFLEDVAGLAAALVDLAPATAEPAWFTWAAELATDAVGRFRDPDGGYFQTADDAETLMLRPKDTWDNATPSGNSLLASVCWQLALLTGDAAWRDRATEIVRAFQDQVRQAPTGFGELLQVVEALAAESLEVAIVGHHGPDRDRLVRAYRRAPRPGTVLAVADPDDAALDDVPLLAGRGAVDGRPAAYVCRNFACDRPTSDADELLQSLAG